MRIEIKLDDRIVAELDRRIGHRNRGRFIAESVRRALREKQRRDDIIASLGVRAGARHESDDDAAASSGARRGGSQRGLERRLADVIGVGTGGGSGHSRHTGKAFTKLSRGTRR